MNNKIRMLTVAYLLSALPVMLTAQDTTCNPGVDYMMQAQQAVTENRFIGAIDAFNCAIESDPNNATLYGGRGLAFMLYGDTVSGASDYQRYEQLTGTLQPFMAQQIDQFFVTEAPQSVVVAQSTTPETAQGYYQRGLQLQTAGAYDRAILAYNRAIDLDPNNPLYFGARGMTYWLFDSLDLARQDFQRYAQLTGNLQPFMRQLMTTDATTTITPQEVNAPPRVTTGDADSYYRRGMYYQQNGELDMALFDYGIALQLAPDTAQYHATRGLAFALDGQPEQALLDYRAYRNLTGDYQNFMIQQIPSLQRSLAEKRHAENG